MKFSNLNFPLYGFDYEPDFIYDLTKIYISHYGNAIIVDDKSLKNFMYIDRLIELEAIYGDKRIVYDLTLRNMSELLKSKCKVAIDNFGRIRNFTVREKFKAACKQVVKVRNNYVWFKGISYPYMISGDIDTIKEYKDSYFGKLVYVNNVWYLLEMAVERETLVNIWL